ncbi:TPA: hypothetical protein HA344_00165, partial [Candidatus Bathyarchaeota archaeon]|nr:hypothetical protein [Candidatus Bathyarchaeota archaeon]
MVSEVAYNREVTEAHASGDLHVHGLGERGGCWASWDSSAIVEKGVAGNTAEHLLQFAVKARHEWHNFQRLSGFESLMGGIVGDSEKTSWLKTLITGLGEDGGRVLLGLEEQSREDSGRVLEAIFAGLRSPAAQTGRLAPAVVFTDAYDWGSESDLSLYEPANALCSPIFMHRREATTRRAVDPWLDGAAPGVNTGVLGAVTLNLPRAAFTSGDEGEFFEHVWNLTGLAVDGLEAKRAQLDAELKAGDMPATGSVVDSFDDFFGAVGVVGVNEALINLVEREIGSMQGKVIAYKVLEAIQDRLEEKDK